MDNLLLKTDSYKLTHFEQYPKDTATIFSYFESRRGAKFPSTVFFGLQYLLEKYLVGEVVTTEKIDEAEDLVATHMGDAAKFNREGWEYIVRQYDGRLPLIIKAIPEGTVVPTNNVLMTVQNTDPKCYWLTNYMETLLTHVWYSSTVATLSYHTKKMIEGYLKETAETLDGLDFMLHDFGYRGATSDEAAGIGGAGHLVNFKGTDTIAAMSLLRDYYDADPASLAFSVAATEHSIMTALGREGEYEVLDNLLSCYPSGILSVVSDSYNIYKFIDAVCGRKDRVLARDGVLVVRPDSTTQVHSTPEQLTVEIVEKLWETFGGSYSKDDYKILDPHVRVIWGDGIDPDGIELILKNLKNYGYSASNMVFGMGGGLLQKINRDTQRFAFKCSARQSDDGAWHDISKSPLDALKASKAGRLKLVNPSISFDGSQYVTVNENAFGENLLLPVFENGVLLNKITFDQIRENVSS